MCALFPQEIFLVAGPLVEGERILCDRRWIVGFLRWPRHAEIVSNGVVGLL